MTYHPVCLTCQAVRKIRKRLTWSFYLCAECEEEYGRTVEERREKGNEWLNFLIREENNKRNRLIDNNRIKDGKEEYLEDVGDGFFYEFDFEILIMYRQYYENFTIDDSDGVFELQDSDWEAVYFYGV